MNIYLDIIPEISSAIDAGEPVVALETNLITYGIPYPDNIQFARDYEQLIRDHGAVPALTAIMDGKLKVGLSDDELAQIAVPANSPKASRRDMPQLIANKQIGATTVASTMIIAEMAGIKVFCTGGIGGVHREAQKTFDISADLQELAKSNVAVLSAGAKSILDLPLTMEYLETMGVPVIGLRTSSFPAFFCRESGLAVDHRCETEAEVARIIKAKWDMGIKGGIVIGNPIPEEAAMDYDEMDSVIQQAIKEADRLGVKGKEVTLFLLAEIKKLTDGSSFTSNLELLYHNARNSSKLAVELSALYRQEA
ncbi:MAG: pseudouridine-5'-phosphate glycosidase [Anaerolineaceae bacterium]|nr:pseudouridine-5'-phosphate glycosidase [Anaerolineaceae bacterium]